jgi:hypothetical protein
MQLRNKICAHMHAERAVAVQPARQGTPGTAAVCACRRHLHEMLWVYQTKKHILTAAVLAALGQQCIDVLVVQLAWHRTVLLTLLLPCHNHRAVVIGVSMQLFVLSRPCCHVRGATSCA